MIRSLRAGNNGSVKKKDPLTKLFENDELDEAVINADDTGLLAEQHEIVEEEPLIEEERRHHEKRK